MGVGGACSTVSAADILYVGLLVLRLGLKMGRMRRKTKPCTLPELDSWIQRYEKRVTKRGSDQKMKTGVAGGDARPGRSDRGGVTLADVISVIPITLTFLYTLIYILNFCSSKSDPC